MRSFLCGLLIGALLVAGSPGWLLPNAQAAQQVASVNASVYQSQPAQLFKTFRVLIGDINADGYADFALSDPFNGPTGRVELRSGSTGVVLRTFESPPGESSYGGSTFPSCDMDGDGVPDVAIASILPEQAGEHKGIVRVYSSTSGKELAYIKELNAANIEYTDVKVIGDPNNDKIIDERDLLLTINTVQGIQTATDTLQVDLNKDGAVDSQDIFELIGKLGQVSPQQCEVALVNLLNAAGEQMQDPNWQWTQDSQGQSAQAMMAGPAGCAWCFIKCAYWMKKAADCGDKLKAALESCFDWQIHRTYEAQVVCYENTRRTFLTNCLKDVAKAAGKCGQCVAKCAPKPTS